MRGVENAIWETYRSYGDRIAEAPQRSNRANRIVLRELDDETDNQSKNRKRLREHDTDEHGGLDLA